MQCSKCFAENLSVSDFDTNNRGSRYSYCKTCRRNQRQQAAQKRYQKPENKLKKSLQHKNFRQDPIKRANVIAIDSKSSDKKHNREYNLTLDKIKELISRPCSYCEETELQMTLDRIDNKIGHIESNVIPACIRCNLIRKAMPYEAWILLVPGLKEAKKNGAFGEWIGR
jgi:hypothetical protein